jgi:hypothetical protein
MDWGCARVSGGKNETSRSKRIWDLGIWHFFFFYFYFFYFSLVLLLLLPLLSLLFLLPLLLSTEIEIGAR